MAMAYQNSVRVLEVCRVVPHPASPDSSASPSNLPLTLFDIRWLRFTPVERLYFYEVPSSNKGLFDAILAKLKTSLSVALRHYVPLAGNLTWPQDSSKPLLHYLDGDSVSLTIAESDADFYRLSSNGFLDAEEYHPFVPQLEVSHEKAAGTALQITVFPNCGFSIGTSMHHAVLDGKSSTSFVKSWAHLCKHGGALLPDELNPFYDRSVIQDPADFGAIQADQLLNVGGFNNKSLMPWEFMSPPGSIRGTFEFTRSKIQTLRQSLMAKKAEKKQDDTDALHVSTFSLTCAYTWVCIVKAEIMKSETSRLLFSVDGRLRLDPPIPANYFGSCVTGCVAVAETKDLLGEDGFVVAVNAISKAIKSLEEGILKRASRTLAVGTERILTLAGSPRFGVYDTDFGWGRPKKVDIVSIDRTRAISFSDTRNGAGGIEVGLVLEKKNMEVFTSLFAEGLENQ